MFRITESFVLAVSKLLILCCDLICKEYQIRQKETPFIELHVKYLVNNRGVKGLVISRWLLYKTKCLLLAIWWSTHRCLLTHICVNKHPCVEQQVTNLSVITASAVIICTSPLVQTIDCQLFDAKPLFAQILAHVQLQTRFNLFSSNALGVYIRNAFEGTI